MLTSIRGLTAASLVSAAILSATPALADDHEESTSEFEVSGNVAIVSDYRFRGVSFSNGEVAIQGGVDVAHSSGFYVGTWASSIEDTPTFGEVELDLYAGWSGDVGEGVSIDVGLLYYAYPAKDEPPLAGKSDYFEPYASISGDLGPVTATAGIAYAWDQGALGNQDNLYLYTDLEAGIPDTPISVSAHLGYTDGVLSPNFDQFGNQSSGFDWGLGASWAVTDSLSLGVNYVDTEGFGVEDFTDAGFFFTLGYSM